MSDFKIEPMTRSQLDFAVELAAKEGWNPGLHDADPFYKADPNGYLMGYLDGAPIGCISAVSYENEFGFMGFYILLPEFRGKGYGIQLWNAAIERLDGFNVGLDGVIEQQENYKKSGFKFAYSNIRYEWINAAKSFDDKNIVETSSVPFEKINSYDRKIFPANRTPFLHNWIKIPESFSFTYLNDDYIEGYGVIRKCRVGYKIGPLFAENSGIAENIFLKLCSSVDQKAQIYLDVPEVNDAGMKIASKYSMQKVFGTARMYNLNIPDLPVDKIFGVTTFELG